jgi:phenylpropionate dioxygenase-like ring-hydroxylating dioxygenase large terminal subunit
MISDSRGRLSSIQCLYHGWNYDLQGKLKGTPEFTGVKNFCRENYSLPRFQVGTWENWVGVHLGEPTAPLSETLSASIDVAETVQQEDIAICESVQKGLQSSHYHQSRYSVERETGTYAFHKCLVKAFSTHKRVSD